MTGATIEFWIQLENHAWDIAPHNIDHMTGDPIDVHCLVGGIAPIGLLLQIKERAAEDKCG